jgi:putative cardiolipin synthase
LVQRLIAAADRGVRVRLLLDDNNLGEDREMAALCIHPNIEVRVFNPFKYRARWARLPQYAVNFDRMIHRMHNKIFIVDNEVAIIGGRNIGNTYFNLDPASNFRDFDLLMVGAVTDQASTAFDEYWNSAWSIPATALVRKDPSPTDFETLRIQMEARVKTIDGLEKENSSRKIEYLRELETQKDALVWAKGEVISEPPRKIQHFSHETTFVSDRLAEEWEKTKSELLIECAYLVPTRQVDRALRALREQGVAVKIMTSALEASDVTMVYTAYTHHRRALLRAGIELYEYKGQPALTRSERTWYRRPRLSSSALHSKAIVFDRQRVWIGSFNLDPRSVSLNTEIAVLVQSDHLAAQMADYIAEDFSPRRSWRVQLEKSAVFPPVPPRRGNSVREHITWTGESNGKLSKRYRQPAASGWQRLKEFLYSLVPGIESQL